MKKLTGIYLDEQLLEDIKIYCVLNKTDLTKLTNKLLSKLINQTKNKS